MAGLTSRPAVFDSMPPLPLPLDGLRAHPGPLLVGFSGGLDSCVLLHRLIHEPSLHQRTICAVHVHHGLHPDADAWQQHCVDLCAKWQVSLRCIQVRVKRQSGDGLEAAARQVRHAAFAQALPETGILTLAQHQDDQAETVLLRALRGSGVDGMAAMRPWRAFAHGWLWRPLLALPRTQLAAYAHAHGLRWIEDPSNAHTRFERNYLRHEVMPRLTARWPHAAARLAQVATLQAEAQALLDAELEPQLAACLHNTPDTLDVDCLRQHPPARRARLLRALIARLGLPPLPGHAIARIEASLLAGSTHAPARFQWHKAELTRWRHLLHAGLIRAPLPVDFSCRWHPHTPLALPGGGQLALICAQPVPADLIWQVRARQGGERIILPGRPHSHRLKHVLQQCAIPPWVRQQLPVVCAADGTILAAGDAVYSATFAHWLHQHQAQLRWDRPGKAITPAPANGAQKNQTGAG